MEVILAKNCGFCYGVKRAIELAEKNVEKDGSTYTLGPIIHNPQMVNKLAAKGIGMVNSVDELNTGTLIIRSHGVGPNVYTTAEAKGLNIVDATCPHVKKAQQAARELSDNGYQVIIVGEKDHPEVISILEWTNNQAVIIENEQQALEYLRADKIGVVAQTTFSCVEFAKIVNILTDNIEDAKIYNTVCSATEVRQQAATELAAKVDVMIIIGGRNSANTTRLAELCSNINGKVYHVETANELQQEWFSGVDVVGITAGASTPDWIIKEVHDKLVEFDSKENIEIDNIEVGSLVKGTVVNVREDEVFVDIGYKAEGIISKNDLAYPTPEKASDIVEAGQIIDVYVIAIEDAEGGSVKLSKIKADQIQAWLKLERAFASGETLEGIVQEIVKGGITVAVCGLRGFVPASHIDLNHVDDLNQFIGQTILMKPIEVIPDNKKLVLSRRKYLLEQKLLNEQKVMDSLAVNQIVKGTVSRITNFGAFVNLGGIDGLIHVSDLAWHRVKSANEIVNIGDEVEVVVLNIDHNQRKIALSLKQATRDPWFDKAESLSVGSLVAGTVSKTAKFGAFVTLKDGLEGLIHLSELAEDRVNNVEDVVSVGDQITVKVLEVDKKNKKIRLSLSQAKQEQERSEYQQYLSKDDGFGMTIGDKFKHLFKTEN